MLAAALEGLEEIGLGPLVVIKMAPTRATVVKEYFILKAGFLV
jgi:hypothetical protein